MPDGYSYAHGAYSVTWRSRQVTEWPYSATWRVLRVWQFTKSPKEDVMEGTRSIEFKEGRFVVKTLSGDELVRSYRLRHKVFAESLKWVPTTEDGQEMDVYDLWGTTIGLLRDDGALLGMARLLPSSGLFMLEKDLSALLPAGYAIRKHPDTAEITRLAIDPAIRDKGMSAQVMLAVLKGIYQWAVENDVRYYYLAVEHRFLRVLRALGFPCEPLGEPVAVPPAGASSVAALYDMVRFDEENAVKRPEFLRWMTTIETEAGTVLTRRDSSFAKVQEARALVADHSLTEGAPSGKERTAA